MALSIFYHHGATAVYDDGIVCPTVQRFLFSMRTARYMGSHMALLHAGSARARGEGDLIYTLVQTSCSISP
jgi:hypothetical protein